MANTLFSEAHGHISRQFIEQHFKSPGAYWNGRNYYCLNPSRPDKNIGSFSVRDDGIYYDFATGDNGDIFDILATIQGKSAADIARDIIGHTERAPEPRASSPEAIRPDWKPFSFLPAFSDPTPSFVTVYNSKNIDGEPMFVIVRRDYGGKKEIFPLYYTGGQWIKGLPPSLGGARPLIPFDNTKTVLIVEGEKCQTIAARSLSMYSVTTWHGGAGSATKVMLDGLDGADIILWPDADDVGVSAMIDIASRLASKGCKVRMVDPPKDKFKGWDIADCISEDGGLERAKALLEVARELSLIELGVEAPTDEPQEERNATDMGNAERFVDRYGDIVKYNSEKKKWCVWGNGKWSDREQSAITPMIKETIRSMALSGDKDAIKFAMDCESRPRISALIDLAAREPHVAAHETDFDAEPMILNCRNGVVDLATGKLKEHNPGLMCSMMTNTNYNPNTECPKFMKFLDDITLSRPDISNFMQRWFGYSLTGSVSAQTFAIFYGNGANGKSTLVELISRIMGDYSRTAPPDTFIMKQAGAIPNDVASLRGARLVLATETNANEKLAESKIKGMTGGDVIVARFLHGEFFQFNPSWKIVISTNHRPRVSGGDYGIWRRIILVPFDYLVQGPKIDYELSSKLWEEREGILAWMVEGCRQWVKSGGGRKGLDIPKVLLEETQEYREDEDIIGRFVRSRCVTASNDPLMRRPDQILISASDLYQAFTSWADEDGERYASKMTQTAFGRAMRERGFPSEAGRNGRRQYVGIQIDQRSDRAAAREAYNEKDD